MRSLFLFLFSLIPASTAFAQVDSVVVTGRILNLSARLYGESPTVFISRNNILQASRELVRPAPLNVDGTFRVSMPLIYPQEEMYFNYGRISTAFLAAPGTLSVDLNADSLFTAAVPFRFGGVNAQVNGQFARYRAFEAALPDKPDARKLSEQVADRNAPETYRFVLNAYQTPLRQFTARQTTFPLVSRWIQSVNRYNAAGFVYDKAIYEGHILPLSLNDSLRPPADRLLTAARASAMSRFADYAVQQISKAESSRAETSTSIETLSSLLLRYGPNLSETERTRLEGYRNGEPAKGSDLRFFQGLIKRSNDTIQRLVSYENLIRRGREQFDQESVNYLTAYLLANALPALTLDFAKLLYSYARPQIKDPQLAQSLEELYSLEVKDSVRIRAAVRTLTKASADVSTLEISPGVFVTRNPAADGSTLFDQVINANRGKVIYVLLTRPSDEAGRQAALNAQRLRGLYNPRDFALVYLPIRGTDPLLWPELAVRYNLSGDHLLLTNAQLMDAVGPLRPDSELSATVINRVGKVVKRNAPLPGALDDIRKVVDKHL